MPLPEGAALSRMLKDAEPGLLALTLPPIKIRTSGERAFELAELTRANFETWVVKAPKRLHPEHVEDLLVAARALPMKAAIFQAATTALGLVERLPTFDELAKRMRFLDEELFGYIVHRLRYDVALAPILKAIRKGHGYWDDGQDVVAECGIIRSTFERIKDGFPYTLEQVDGFEREATAFMAAIKGRRVVGEHEHEVRSRAWTDFAFDYGRVKRAGRYLVDDASRERVDFPGLAPA